MSYSPLCQTQWKDLLADVDRIITDQNKNEIIFLWNRETKYRIYCYWSLQWQIFSWGSIEELVVETLDSEKNEGLLLSNSDNSTL